MQNAFRDDEPLSRRKADGSALKINGQLPFNHIKEFIIVIVFVPMVLTLDYTDPNHRCVDLAKGLIEPRNMSIREFLLIDDFERSMQDI